MSKSKKVTKNYAQKIAQQKRYALLEEVTRAIDHHERFRNAYFFTPPQSAGERRRYEKRNSITVKFQYDGHEYIYWCDIYCSCKYVYYNHGFGIDDEGATVRPFKKVQTELENAISAYNKNHSAPVTD